MTTIDKTIIQIVRGKHAYRIVQLTSHLNFLFHIYKASIKIHPLEQMGEQTAQRLLMQRHVLFLPSFLYTPSSLLIPLPICHTNTCQSRMNCDTPEDWGEARGCPAHSNLISSGLSHCLLHFLFLWGFQESIRMAIHDKVNLELLVRIAYLH